MSQFRDYLYVSDRPMTHERWVVHPVTEALPVLHLAMFLRDYKITESTIVFRERRGLRVGELAWPFPWRTLSVVPRYAIYSNLLPGPGDVMITKWWKLPTRRKDGEEEDKAGARTEKPKSTDTYGRCLGVGHRSGKGSQVRDLRGSGGPHVFPLREKGRP